MISLNFENYNPKESEKQLVSFWEDSKITDKINLRNKHGKNFYFLQGPPYTSGNIHCGHAWNHALKDMVLRYKRMQGFNVLARAGYDVHGLPTEHKVQAKFGLKQKEDIEAYGLDKFATECVNWTNEKSAKMTEDLKQLGITLDFTDPYLPITEDYFDSVWYLIKQADNKKHLYLGEKTISWCASCATALAKHEQEYKEVRENSIFLKFKKAGNAGTGGTDNEYFIIWTTTPWTIPFNLAIMVNPDMDYVKAKITYTDGKNKGQEEFWYVCKELANIFLSNVDDIDFEIVETFAGSRLEGMKYIHPWASVNPDIAEIQKNSPKAFTVLLSTEYVDASAGTGLVHCAPGCGPEDYEVGMRNGIPPYNVINEYGVFPARIPKYAGNIAKKDDLHFVKMMREEGFLVKTSPVDHEYAHCERCHNPVVFRTTKQWFFKTEDLKKRMLELNSDVNWYPEKAKNAFNSWLENLRDNSITKQRYWGTPAPIWISRNSDGDIDEYYVVSSTDELKKIATTPIPENLHKPWIDSVKIKSPNTGKELARIPDVLDVWIDAGCASWASLYYPSKKNSEEEFEKFFPADYINEGKDQIRGWFNLLMVASVIAHDKVPFKNVGMHGFIADVDGVKMSKSLGNVISPDQVIEKSSVDNFRYYFSKTKAGEDIAFSWEQLSVHQRHLTILWNTAKYFLDLVSNASKQGLSFHEALVIGKQNLQLEEKYVLSKTNSTVKKLTSNLEKYQLDNAPALVGDLFLSISRDYIKATRDKANSEDKAEVSAVIYTLYESLSKTILMFAPICPFISEMIYQNFKGALHGVTADSGKVVSGHDPHIHHEFSHESVHMAKWPTCDESLIDESIESAFMESLEVVSGILAAREKAKLNVRQPVSKAIVITTSDSIVKSIEKLNDSIVMQANLKDISVVSTFDKLEYKIKPNYKEIGKDYGVPTAAIATQIMTFDKEKAKLIKATIKSGKPFAMKVNDSANGLGEIDVELKEQHVVFDISISMPYVMAETPQCMIVIDTTLTSELIAEGLSRELIRRIQSERKTMGLVKSDVVSVKMNSSVFFEIVSPHLDLIKSICGAKTLELTSDLDSTLTVSVEIKEYKFNVLIKQIN